ncbi:P-selectin glycoprotein ligand 1 [Conger conger]|uniref:P-selectin glycoprotein ligand 1 n=1 Tax=Conger conger TaxID=82655 RepID=UPI002A5ABA81|nr:P-selectin glycoprotein ligand 1 [Conger conger]XP_061116760.1 P-selectin glycoprotein ligand 1 [Conger conger]
MDTAFSKMAEKWALLLLLLSLVSPLLSGRRPTQGQPGDFPQGDLLSSNEAAQPTVSPATRLIQDSQNDTFTTVATRGLDSVTHAEETTTETETIETTTENYDEATAETETMETTTENYEDSATDQDSVHVTGSLPTTSGQSTTSSEAETTDIRNDEVTAQSSALSWHETSTASVTTSDSAETSDTPTENFIAMKARAETALPAVTRETSTQHPEPPTSNSASSTQHPEPSMSSPANSTQHPEPPTSNPANSTNSTTRAPPASVYPGGKPQVPDPAVTKPAPTKGSRAPADKGGLPCVTPKSRKDGLVGQCLIAIVTLAGVATVFIVSTTVLCTKLSARKYRYRMRQSSGTEMTCISALLPDGNGAHGRPRTPKSNGALLPNLEDGEGDDLTLHSFLPEMERGS